MSLFWKIVLSVIVAFWFVGMGFGVGVGIGLAAGVLEVRNADPTGHGGIVIVWYAMVGGFLGLCTGCFGFLWWLSRKDWNEESQDR